MKNLKNLFLVSVVFLLSMSFMPLKPNKYNEITAITAVQDTTKWIAPDTANALSNPFEVNDENIAAGKLIYRSKCRSCHGRHGDGQGVEAEDIDTVTPSFLTNNFAKQSDGAIFWKISEGRNDMKSYKKALESSEIWNVIMYIKTFSKASE